jgi:glyoxylase-like metal-dependent hydrolase (beta-lactamase superfamily II)
MTLSNYENIELEEISPQVVVNTSGLPDKKGFRKSGNFGAVSLGTYAIAIDSGRSPEALRIFRKKYEKYFDTTTKYFFLTHTHTDHRNGAGAYKDCTMICSQKLANIMPKSFKLSSWDIITFDDKHIVEEQDLRIEFHHTGGHTAGSSFLYFPSEKVVFAGDLVLVQFPYLTFTGDRTCNFDKWIAALNHMNTLSIDKIIPGHGHIVDGKSELKKHLEMYQTLKAVVKEAINENRKPNTIELPNLEYIEDIVTNHLPTLDPKKQKWWENALAVGQQNNLINLYKFYQRI